MALSVLHRPHGLAPSHCTGSVHQAEADASSHGFSLPWISSVYTDRRPYKPSCGRCRPNVSGLKSVTIGALSLCVYVYIDIYGSGVCMYKCMYVYGDYRLFGGACRMAKRRKERKVEEVGKDRRKRGRSRRETMMIAAPGTGGGVL